LSFGECRDNELFGGSTSSDCVAINDRQVVAVSVGDFFDEAEVQQGALLRVSNENRFYSVLWRTERSIEHWYV
jgi:hypothetical protein